MKIYLSIDKIWTRVLLFQCQKVLGLDKTQVPNFVA